MSRVSRKVNELKLDLDSISGVSYDYVFKQLIKIKLIIYDIQKYVDGVERFYEEDFYDKL